MEFLGDCAVAVEERQAVDIELLAFQAELPYICTLDLIKEIFFPLIRS